jgi:hypothetical protein
MEVEIKNNTATDLIVAKQKREPKPQSGLWIVWRFKDNKGWREGYIKQTMAKGRILKITETNYSHDGETVALADIDWYRR